MEYELPIRLGAFLGLFALFAALEAWAPRRARSFARARRWPTNIAIVLIDAATVRAMALALPLLAVGAALDAETQGWGLLNQFALPGWLAVVLAVLAMDLAIWAQHVAFHKVGWLWRLHRVHHADRDFDVTTALRFHPIEIAASMLIKIGVVYAIGAPAWGVVAFEVLLNGSAMFNHANLRLAPGLDRVLRRVLVTPDMHRVHHSVHRHEADSNYGFALSIWDRIFGTYRDQPEDGHDGMVIGLKWQDERPTRLGWSLKLPFMKD